MQATRELNRAGQSLWLDNITRELLSSGTLKRYIDELSVTGLTSNPTIFDHAMKHGSAYDEDIRQLAQKGLADEKLFFELAREDLIRAADLFRPVHERTAGVDGWVSLEVSPRLAYDTNSTLAEARDLHARAARPNLFIKIPGTKEGLPAIESAIFAGVPINVTLLFSPQQYVAARGGKVTSGGSAPSVRPGAPQRAPAAFFRAVALELITPIRLSQEATKAAAPSCCSFAARAARSTPALVNSASTVSLSPPSARIASPTFPWSANAFRVFSGMVLTVSGATRPST